GGDMPGSVDPRGGGPGARADDHLLAEPEDRHPQRRRNVGRCRGAGLHGRAQCPHHQPQAGRSASLLPEAPHRVSAAVTAGTLLGLMGTGAILLAAIVGAIWLEARMATQSERRLRPPAHLRQPSLMIVSAGSKPAIHEVS